MRVGGWSLEEVAFHRFEQEQGIAPAPCDLLQGSNYVLHPIGTRCHVEDKEIGDTKVLLVNFLRKDFSVGEHFPMVGGLGQIGPQDRHTLPIGFQHKKAVRPRAVVLILEPEHSIGNDPQGLLLPAVREADRDPERVFIFPARSLS